MSKLASVTVAYGRKIQPAPYESADASVSLTLAFDPEQDATDQDAEIAASMQRAVSQVEAALGLKSAPKKPASKPAVKANFDVGGEVEAPAPAVVKEEAKPAPAAADDPFGETATAVTKAEEPATSVTKKDLTDAITQAMTRLKAKGVANGSEEIKKLVTAYLPDGKPPYTYNRIPESSWGDFFSDIQKLGR